MSRAFTSSVASIPALLLLCWGTASGQASAVLWEIHPGEFPHSGILSTGDKVVTVGQGLPRPGAQSPAPAIKTTTLSTGASQVVFLQPAGKPNASGSATSIGDDATCVAGYQDNGFFTPYHALLWTETGGPVDLGTLEPAANADRSSFATGVNQDCSVVVGSSGADGGATQRAFRWTPGGGMVSLGLPAGARASSASRAFAINPGGTVIVGDAEFADGNSFSGFRNGAFRHAGGVFQDLGSLEAGFFSVATAVSGDGSVVVGQAGVSVKIGNTFTNGSKAFRWTAGGGPVALGPLPGDSYAAATGVSDDGNIVVGTSSTGPLARGNLGFNTGTGAFRWTAATGTQDLRQLAINAGIDMTGITFVAVTGISPDGQWITGAATTAETEPGATAAFVMRYCDAATTACGDAPAPNYQGLWWNAQESGWGINFAHQGDVIFATWFTFGADNKPQWYTVVAQKTGTGIYAGAVSSFTGPPFSSVPFPANANVKTTVGSATITFAADGKNASFAYTVNGISQVKQIVPQQFSTPVPSCVWGAQADLTLATNYQDLWWVTNGDESGWGINFTHQGSIIFATWFTYDVDGKAWWLFVVAAETATPKVYAGQLKTATGPPFSAQPFDPNAVVRTTVGNATITIIDGNHARLDYTVNGVTQSKNLVRQVFAAPGTVCH